MRVTISARQIELSDALRDRARSIADRLGQLTPFAQDARIVFGQDGAGPSVEVRIRLSGQQVVVASGTGADHRTALDRAEDKLRRQLRRPPARPVRKRGSARKP